MSSAVLAEVVRSGFVEGRHVGSLVAVAADGTVLLSLGAPDRPVFPRSSNKPAQALGMLDAGLAAVLSGVLSGGDGTADSELLAMVTASHSGEQRHLALVRALLARVSLTEESLGCPAALPLDEVAAAALLRSGAGPDRVHMNCSGKHAGMLATCVAAGWPVADYLRTDHPLQRRLHAALGELAGEPVAAVGVDGCGAPVHALSLTGLARSFSRLVAAEPGTPRRLVADAMRDHPELVGGSGRDVTALMAGVPGLLAKDGAEGVYAVATADGTGIAVKIDDGAARARVPVLVAALRALGVDAPVFDTLATLPVLGGGKVVGAVRALPVQVPRGGPAPVS